MLTKCSTLFTHWARERNKWGSTQCSTQCSTLCSTPCSTLCSTRSSIINMVQKHQKQRDAPFNGPIVYSTIESIRSEFSGRNFVNRLLLVVRPPRLSTIWTNSKDLMRFKVNRINENRWILTPWLKECSDFNDQVECKSWVHTNVDGHMTRSPSPTNPGKDWIKTVIVKMYPLIFCPKPVTKEKNHHLVLQ